MALTFTEYNSPEVVIIEELSLILVIDMKGVGGCAELPRTCGGIHAQRHHS